MIEIKKNVKNVWFLVFTLILGGFLLLINYNHFLISIDPVLLLLLFLGLFLSNIIDLKLHNFSFMTEFLIIIPFLLFVSPETITIFSSILKLLFSKNNKTIKFSFSFLMLSFGTFLYHLVPIDYLKIPVFTVGFLAINMVLVIIFFEIKIIKRTLFSIFKVYLLIITLSFVLSFAYILPEIKKEYMLLLFIVYAFISYFMYEYVKEYNVYILEKIENKKLKNVNENLEKLKDFIFNNSLSNENLEQRLSELMKIVSNISGFKVAVMSVFDRNSNKVIRIAQHGLDNSEFEKIKKQNPTISDIIKYFDRRFEKNGIYFIPRGVTLFDDNIGYVISEKRKIDNESQWDPLDLLLVPIEDEDSNIIGYISLDLPESGLRPTLDELSLLRFLSWVIFEVLKKTPLSRYWITEKEKYLKNISYSSFIRACENIIRTSEKVVLAFIDIDEFDKINLEKGPEFADSISSQLETYFFEKFKNAIFYKISGETFIVLFQDVSKSSVLVYLNGLIKWIKEKNPGISLSIGISYDFNKQKGIFDLIFEAKKALEVAKKSGGGRIQAL